MESIVKKLNARGGYIYMPKEWIGKKVKVVLIQDESVLIYPKPKVM